MTKEKLHEDKVSKKQLGTEFKEPKAPSASPHTANRTDEDSNDHSLSEGDE